MKTAISIPDAIFNEAERLARRVKTTRSELYGRALKEFVARHAPDRVTEAMDCAIAECGQPADPALAATARQTLVRSEW
jgi:metal-responsive CopG/Arc/MetJ family transcriptional regulator